ncbi:hypothetical protein Lgra_1571 [Legionella gratiana]|uniref:Uncharacterized protein n=1 Tax=Legionella gratiana TaxID=45066 RepID=A0A378J970_9GAMM|nr:hypothetical protein [Legionella gratiana]KTD10605.1 hypothetical protein Lgra_1571 [Legionella gratiana]STX43511.1 Uncharacterised protein [Legionella gratiana]
MKELTFFKGYQQDEQKRAAFNHLAVKTFDLSFGEWYQSSYWRDKYIPYTLFDGEHAIANVSVNIMDFSIKKEQNLDDIIHALSDETIDTVRLGFVPKDCSSYEIIPIDEKEKDEMLFVETGKTALFDENQLMFPLLSHA